MKPTLQSLIDQTIPHLQAISDQKAQIAAITDAAVHDLNINPKVFTKICNLTADDSADEVFALNDEVRELYLGLMSSTSSSDRFIHVKGQ